MTLFIRLGDEKICGILGFISKDKDVTTYNNKRLDFLFDGLTTGHVRGDHGTGLFYVPRENNSVFSYKLPIPGPIFADLKAVTNSKKDLANAGFVVAHHRKAFPVNDLTVENTHPFTHGKITLVHNGGVTHTWDLYDGPSIHFDVDSEYIAYALSKVDDPKIVLSKLRGAYALVWYNSETDCLYFARNDERPFSFAYEEGGDSLYFASESGHLRWLASRNKITTDKMTFYTLNPGWLFTIPKDNPTEYKTEEFKVYVPPPTNAYNQWQRRNNNNGKKGNGGATGKPANGNIHRFKSTANYDSFFKAMPEFKVGERINFYLTSWNENTASRKSNPKGLLLGFYKQDIGVSASGIRKRVVDNHELGYFSGVVSNWQVAFNKASHGQNYELIIQRGTLEPESYEEEVYTPFDNNFYEDDFEGPLFLLGPGRELLSRTQWKEQVQHGCIYCGDPIDINDHDHIVWDNHGPICPACMTGNALLLEYKPKTH